MNHRLLPLLLLLSPIAVAPAAEKPNILFILADDLAWSDLACYGHGYHETPHLDELAGDGLRFTNGYAPAPICSASRAAILTGKTTARLHFEFVTKAEPGYQTIDKQVPLRAPPFTLNLSLNERTIPEYLEELGYDTGFFGKWHLNAHHGRYLGWSPIYGPSSQGFRFAVEDFGSHPYSWGKRGPEPITSEGVFPDDSMIDRAIGFIEQPRDRPFFLMLSLFHVHTPVRTRCEWLLDKYGQKIAADSPNRELRVAYAAFLEELDHHVGNVLQALDAAGLRDQTLVVFTSDNGGHPQYTANAPLRGSKWNLYEGGIRVPLIARWPQRIPTAATCDQPVVGYDLLPTMVEIAGGQVVDVDGFSIAALLNDPLAKLEREIVWHFPYYHPERGYAAALDEIGTNDFEVSKTHPQSAMRQSELKLIYFHETEAVELYNLADDLSEQHDLSAIDPMTTQRMTDRLLSTLRKAKARFPSLMSN